jgi:hypothetical protein
LGYFCQYSLIINANLHKPIDIVAIFNFADPIPTKGGAIYITYAYISPRSTQHRIHNQYTPFYMVMHSPITDQLLPPTPTYKKDPNMPPLAQHLSITLPHINAINEKLIVFIEGIHPKFILGDKQNNNTNNLRHLGYTIHRAITTQFKDQLPHDFPKPNNRCHTANSIATKLVRSLGNHNTPHIPPILGIVIPQDEPTHSAIKSLFTDIIINNKTPIHLFGCINTFSFNIHFIPQNPQKRNQLVTQIIKAKKEDTYSTYKLICNVQVNYNFFTNSKTQIAIVHHTQLHSNLPPLQ